MMSWLYTGLPNTPADIVYHGLFNQGATCYLNSVLQVLFMTEDFREAVERYDPHNPECIDPQLRHVFDELLKKTSTTNDITKKLGIHTVWEQQDAAEYFEKILTLTSSEASQIFHGESTQKITCSRCRKENNRDGRFWYLPLELVDSHSDVYSVVDGIDEYFRTSHFRGENQIYCDLCETKSDATMTCVMKHHPEVLTLLLKRFDFDYSYMSYVKNNRVVDVPSFLQIPENQTYELYACVEHFGDLRGGHYTVTIKSQDDEKWYNFDDARVTLLDYQPFQNNIIESSNSAYLLFYRKKQNIHTQEISEVVINGGLPLPVAGHDGDECPDVGQMTEQEEGMEVEETAEVGNGKTESVSIDRNEGTGIKENVSVGSAGPDIHQDLKPESSDREATCDSLVSTDKKEDEEEMEVDGSKGKKGANKLTSEQENLTKCPHCGSVIVSGQSPPLVIVDKKAVDEKTRTDDKEEKGGNTGRLELLTKDDVYLEGCEDTGDVGAGEQGGSSGLLERSEQQNDERREEKGDKEPKRGNDEAAQGSTTKPDCSEGVEDQDEGGLDDGGQNGPEETISVHEGVSTEEQAKEHKEPSQSGTGELKENQGGEGVEEMENSQPTERAVVEGGGGSDKTILYGAIIEEEIRTDDKEFTGDVGAGEQGGSSGLLERCERQKDERREEKGDKETKGGNDEAAQGSITKPDCSEGVEDQDEGGLDEGGQNGPEETIGIHEGVGADEQAKENKVPSQLGTGELRENQGGEGVEEMENSPSTERAVVEGGGGSDKTKLYRINDEEMRTDDKEETEGVGAGEQGGSSELLERSEQQKDERREEKGDKETKIGNDEAAQGSTTKPECSEGVEDQDEGGLDEGGQNGPEETIGVHEGVGAEEQAKEHKEPSQSGTGELRENQGGEGVEEIENSQPTERAVVEGGGGSVKTILYGAIIDEKTRTDDKEDKGGNTGRLELLTKDDVYLEGCEDTGDVGAGEQGGSSRLLERSEQQNDERREEKGDKEPKRGNDEAAQGSTTKPDCSEGVEDQDEGGLDDGGQNGPEETICVHEGVGAEEQANENKEPSQSGTGELKENQGGEGVEEMENSQPTERAVVEGGGGSDKTILYGAIIEEEMRTDDKEFTGDVGAGEEGGSSGLLERCEKQKDERREEKGDKETKGGNDEAVHGSQAKPDCSEGVEDQDEGVLDEGGQNGPEETIGVHEGVGADEQAKENKVPSQSGTGELRENQGGEGVEEMENSQSTERAVVEDGGGSDKTIIYGINDKEMRTDDKEETEGVGAGEQGGSSELLERSEQQKDERREEKGDKETKIGDDKAAQGSTTKPDCSEGVEDQDEGGLDEGGQNGPEETIGVHEGVGAEEQAKEHKEPSQSGTGELRENQGGEGVEEIENSQPTERAVVEGGGGSVKTILYGAIIDEKTRTDDKEDKGGNTGRLELLTKDDVYLEGCEDTGDVGAGEQGGSSGLLERSEQQNDERREEKGDKETKIGNDEAAQGSTTKPDCSEGVEDQDEGGLDDGGQNGPEETISVHEGVGAEEQAKENKVPSQSGTGELRENQGGEGVEEMENSQSTERAVVEDRGGSDKTVLYRAIIDEKTRTDDKEEKGDVGAGEEGGSSGLLERSEQQKDERRDGKGDKETKIGNDKAAQGSTTKPDCSESVEDQDEGGLDDGGQNGPEETISVHEGVSTEEQAKEHKEPSQSGTGELRENQGGEGVEEIENSQPTERPVVEGGGGSVKTILYGAIIDEEIEETPSGVQVRIERRPIRIEPGEGAKKMKIHYD